MTESTDRLAHVLRHLDEVITAETIHHAHSGVFAPAGTTEHFYVENQRHLGFAGQVLARDVLGDCEADFAHLTEWFGGTRLDRPDRPVRRTVQTRAARSVRRVPVHRPRAGGAGPRDRKLGRAPTSDHRLERRR